MIELEENKRRYSFLEPFISLDYDKKYPNGAAVFSDISYCFENGYAVKIKERIDIHSRDNWHLWEIEVYKIVVQNFGENQEPRLFWKLESVHRNLLEINANSLIEAIQNNSSVIKHLVLTSEGYNIPILSNLESTISLTKTQKKNFGHKLVYFICDSLRLP